MGVTAEELAYLKARAKREGHKVLTEELGLPWLEEFRAGKIKTSPSAERNKLPKFYGRATTETQPRPGWVPCVCAGCQIKHFVDPKEYREGSPHPNAYCRTCADKLED